MSFNNSYPNLKLKPMKLVLGKKYMIAIEGNITIRLCKFIKVTPKGYNFLADDMDKCFLQKHIYASNSSNHLDGTWFWIPDFMKITEFVEPKPEVVEPEQPTTLSYIQYKEHQIAKGEYYSWTEYKNIVLGKIKFEMILDESGSMKH